MNIALFSVAKCETGVILPFDVKGAGTRSRIRAHHIVEFNWSALLAAHTTVFRILYVEI